MATYGLDVECPHIFDGTHFTSWKDWMMNNFKFISPQLLWIVDVGFSFALDKKNATQAQRKCLYLDCQATNIFYQSMDDNIFGEIMDLTSAHEIWFHLNKKYGMTSNNIDGEYEKMEDHEKIVNDDVELIHDMRVVKECSISSSSDEIEISTTSSLENNDDYSCSVANDDSTSPSTSPLCHMSNDDTKVKLDSDVVAHAYTYDELVDVVKGMSLYVEEIETKMTNLEHENHNLRKSYDCSEHLLGKFVYKLVTLSLTHEILCLKHKKLKIDHKSLIESISKEDTKIDESSSYELDGQLQCVANSCDEGYKNVSTSSDDLLEMPCSSNSDICFSSMDCETNNVEENNESNDEVKNLSMDGHVIEKVTHKQMMESHKKYGNINGIVYNNTNIKGKRWGKKTYEREMRRLEEEKLSHYMCFKCHKMGHLASSCLSKKEKMPQDSSEDESTFSHEEANVNHKVDNKMGRKKTRRGGRRRNW